MVQIVIWLLAGMLMAVGSIALESDLAKLRYSEPGEKISGLGILTFAACVVVAIVMVILADAQAAAIRELLTK